MPRLLVTGASGTLGREVVRQALTTGWEVLAGYHRAPLPLPVAWHQFDITRRSETLTAIAALGPDAVIHTAMQERGPALWATTADGAATVALAAAAAGARLVHISSDALFDGSASPYTEAAPPSPITPYGAAKAAAETAVAAIVPGAAIVRTSLILCRDPLDRHTRFALALLDGQPGRLFTDEVRCPVAVEDLAAAALELAAGDHAGILHVAGAEAVSRHALGCLVARAHGRDPAAVPAGSQAASGLHRPGDVRLDTSLARRVLVTRLRGVSDYLLPG